MKSRSIATNRNPYEIDPISSIRKAPSVSGALSFLRNILADLSVPHSTSMLCRFSFDSCPIHISIHLIMNTYG